MRQFEYSPPSEDTISQDHVRYTLFIWMLPVIFITPLALFSLQEWWQLVVFPESSSRHSLLQPENGAASAWQLQVSLTLAWVAFIQAICWLAYAGSVILGFYRQRKSYIVAGYLILLSSLVLQWQLPPVLAGLGMP